MIYIIAFALRRRFIAKDDPTRKYFINGLNLKMVGAFATAFIYWYYYGSGDTIYYFIRIERAREFISEDFLRGIRLFFPKYFPNDINLQNNLWRIKYHDQSYKMVVQIGTFISFFAARTYLGIALIFSFLSYLGLWLLYRVFYHQYPAYKQYLAYGILYVPSIVFWGSGLFKDTITIGCLSWAVYNVYRIFIAPNRRVLNTVLLVINMYFIIIIKAYIIACFIPMLLAWIVLHYRSRIKSGVLKAIMTPFLIVLTVVGGMIMTRQISSMSNTFSLDQLESRATEMVWWHTQVKEIYGDEGGGSAYSLGNPYDFSTTGIIKKLPLAINVTFFRPYLWEAGNPVMMMSAVESLFLFFFFLYLVVRLRFRLLTLVAGSPFLVFCFGFSLLFAMGVGMTSYNFGALVRYKIPAMPFFIAGLIVVYNEYKTKMRAKAERREVLPDAAATPTQQ